VPDTESRTPRVAVYVDFDNVVISRYDQVHGGRRDAWRADDVRRHAGDPDSVVGQKLREAHVDVGALIDYAASYGRVAFARAYADWSVPVNASYQRQLVDRAVDLTQLFPVSGTKNGADIRLAVDAIDDLMRYDDITHVVLVAGDSDYIALAQRCKQLGRYVVGIGVSGSTSRALVAACDEFTSYDDVPGVHAAEPPAVAPVVAAPKQEPAATEAAAPTTKAARTRKATAKAATAKKAEAATTAEEVTPKATAKKAARTRKAAATTKAAPTTTAEPTTTAVATEPAGVPAEPLWDVTDERQQGATSLLVRALDIASGQASDASGWLFGGGLKSLMQRMDPQFKEKSLGYRTFTAFVESRGDLVESRIDGSGQLRLRLRS
jgi:hypothetical protein